MKHKRFYERFRLAPQKPKCQITNIKVNGTGMGFSSTNNNNNELFSVSSGKKYENFSFMLEFFSLVESKIGALVKDDDEEEEEQERKKQRSRTTKLYIIFKNIKL